MPCSTSRANLSVFNSLRVILDTKTSEYDWKFHLSTAPRAGEWAVTAGKRGQARRGHGRKTTAGSGLRTRGQTGLAANFRQNAPEIHASLVSPGGARGWR